MVGWDNTCSEYIRHVACWQPLQPIILALTYGRHSTDAQGRSCGREVELIQYCVGPSWVNHCNITAGCRARNYPHRTLAEKEGYGVWRDEWHETTCTWEVLVMVGWRCAWWLACDYSCYLTRIITDLLWPLLRCQVWLQQHSSAEENKYVNHSHIYHTPKGIMFPGFLSKVFAGTRFTLAVESLWSNSLSWTKTGTSLGSGTGSWDSYNNDI